MSSHIRNQSNQEASPAPKDDSVRQNEVADESIAPELESKNQKKETIPRWRQIEIMRERAQLREELGDLDLEIDDIDEFEKEVFGTDSENEVLYRHDEAGDDEDADFEADIDEDIDEDLAEDLDTDGLDEEALADDDFEDFDED